MRNDRVTVSNPKKGVIVTHFAVEEYGSDIEDAYRRLFPQRDADRMIENLRWRFLDNPHGKGFFSTAREDGTIIGMIALIACEFEGDTERVRTLQAIDTIVDPEHRGKFLFMRMGKAIYESELLVGYDLVWGFPNDQAARGWFGRLGWSNFGTVPFAIKPLRSGFFARRISAKLKFVDLRLVGRSQSAKIRVETVETFAADADHMLAAYNQEIGFGRTRDRTWLNWRVHGNPEANYRVSILRNDQGAPEAAVVSMIADKHGARIWYLMEAIATSADAHAMRDLLVHESRIAADHGAEIALAWCPQTAPTWPILRRAGFRFFPDRFRPITIYFGGRSLQSEHTELPPAKEWFLSYLDSDTV